MASTAQEALIAELLGDVGKLHDMIKALPDALQTSLTPTIGALTLAAKAARVTIDQHAESQKAALQHFFAHEQAALRDALIASLREAGCEKRRRRSWIWVVLALSLVAGALGFSGATWLFSQQQDEQAAFGRAVMRVWNDLDAKSKALIQAAQRQQ